jgi:hypothetical protein
VTWPQNLASARGSAQSNVTGRMSRWGLVAAEPDGQVGDEPQDHVLGVAEPAGQPQPVAGGLAVPALVVGDPLGHRAADGSAVSMAGRSSPPTGSMT